MIEEEIQENDLTKPYQLIHTNTKISKQQASQMNLMKLVKQCQIQFQIAQNFRECSQYLSELGIIYLKQHQFLKRNLEILQNSLIDQCDDQQQKKELKKKKKQSKIKEKSLDNNISYYDDQPQFNIKENPRNLMAADKLQLIEQQKTPINMHILLKRNNQQQIEYEIDNVVKDLSQINKYSLSDILNQKNQELKNKKKSNNLEQSKQQQLIYHFNDQESESESESEINEVNQPDNLDIEYYYQQIEEKQEISKKTKRLNKKNTSKDEQQQIQKRQKKSKINQLKKTPELDLKIKEDTDEIFKNNLQTFMRHKEKINDLSLEINFLQLEPEFWKHEDELIGLINKISFCQYSNQKKNQEENNFFIFDNLTTEIEHKKLNSQNQGQHSQNKQIITEFSNYEYSSQTPHYQQEQDNKLYQIIIQDIQNTYGKHSRLSSDNFFQVSEKYDCNKPKAFYNLLILSSKGMLQIKNNSNQQCFNEIQIII